MVDVPELGRFARTQAHLEVVRTGRTVGEQDPTGGEEIRERRPHGHEPAIPEAVSRLMTPDEPPRPRPRRRRGFRRRGSEPLAGGGTLISFPILVALGLPAVSANVTNTVALSPGYLGGAIAQRGAIAGQRDRVRRLAVAAGAGGLVGSILLVLTSDDAFRVLIPALLMVATLLLATQDRIRTALRIGVPADPSAGTPTEPGALQDARWLPLPVMVVSVYGGYFGAGLGIMLLAVLGMVLHDRFDRLNALKQVLSFVINTTAALFFLTSGKVYWSIAAVMAVASLVGGSTGGRLAGRVQPARLRLIVVTIGFVVAVVYAIRTWF